MRSLVFKKNFCLAETKKFIPLREKRKCEMKQILILKNYFYSYYITKRIFIGNFCFLAKKELSIASITPWYRLYELIRYGGETLKAGTLQSRSYLNSFRW